jgi:hypothetical protein
MDSCQIPSDTEQLLDILYPGRGKQKRDEHQPADCQKSNRLYVAIWSRTGSRIYGALPVPGRV